MNNQEYIGKIFRVKVIKKAEKWYIGNMVDNPIIVYVEDTDNFEEEELINTIQKCIILEEREGKLIGFILSNRKFLQDIKKIDKKLKEKEEYSQIQDIYLMERLKIKGKVVGLYLVDEGDIGKYYLDTTEIGTYVKKLRANNILFKENTVENEIMSQIRDVVQSIDLTKKEISLRQEQEKEKELIEKAIGLGEGQITRIATLSLRQKIGEPTINEQEINKKQKEQIREEQQKQQKRAQELQINSSLENKELSKVTDVNIKQEMDTKDKVTDMKTLGKLLKDNGKLPQIEGKEFVKIEIIESTQRDNLLTKDKEQAKTNTTRYSFVAISKDGSVVPLEIEQDHAEGNNPREVNYQVSQQGKVSQDSVLSRFKIGEGTLAVKNGKYGEIKVYHSPRKTIGGKGVEGNKSLDRELETDNVWEMKKEERDLAGEYEDGYRSVEEGYQEAKLHEDKSGKLLEKDKMKIEDIDGEKNTKSHVHDQVNYNALAVKWGYYKEGQPNSEKAKEIFQEKRKENPQKQTKEIIEMVTEELEEEIGHDRNNRY